MTFAIYMSSDKSKKSSIKFGSYDPIGMTEPLSLIRTVNKTSWALNAKDFKFGVNASDITGQRIVYIEPSSPFIYAPAADFVSISRSFLNYYKDQGLTCNYNREIRLYTCSFDKSCDDIQRNIDADF